MLKASANCWTCKQRKVGCDRTLPSCHNCKRGERDCQGYDLRLSWPEKPDRRRKQKRYEAVSRAVVTKYVPRNDGRLAFLNTAVEDLDGSRLCIQDLAEHGTTSFIENAIPISRSFFSIDEQDGMLLNHYDLEIARITTTIDDDSNGFRLALIPMALSSSDLSARSILHSTLAVASYHLGRPQEALKHKIRAIQDLSDSFSKLHIESMDSTTKTRHFAASMMLCVYGVFDESDTAWYMHLEGARSIYDTMPETVKSSADYKFLKPWFRYHYILSQYTYPPQAVDPITILPNNTVENCQIVGVLGCSTELLDLIGCTNQLRGLQLSPSPDNDCESHTPITHHHHTEILDLMETRLLNLRQDLVIQPGLTSGAINHARITFTAELYRITAVLYFYQIAPISFLPAITPPALVRNGLNILWGLKICSSPWPLFILACSVTEDEDRIKILDLMEASGTSRRIGNYNIIIGLVKAVWKRQDLILDEKMKRAVDWRDLVEEGGYMPSFI